MPLRLTPTNLLQFYTFLSPILISTFLLFMGFFNGTFQGIVYLICVLINHLFGMGFKTFFSKYPRFLRTPIKMNYPLNAGQTVNSMPDYCNVFVTPWFNQAVNDTSMPSLNAMFHSFTFVYLLCGIMMNPTKPAIPLLVILGITALANMGFRTYYFCDKMQDILVGTILGGLIGFGLFSLLYYSSDSGPTLVFFAKEDNSKKCKLSKTKFRCSYS